jgi:ubiquinone/menaquinone biosynthesis C-methylase UbiE/catechol 2,3-dioxygenase-like lactoylglutathione lyase family enzyme
MGERIDMKQSIVHAALVVRDYDEAIRFFTETLDFTVVEDSYQPPQDKRWVLIAPPGSSGFSLLLARARGEEQERVIGKQTGGRVFLFLGTDDFWRDYHRMMARGVRFVRPPKVEPYGTVAVFEDLYGNLWDLLQLNAAHSPSRGEERGASTDAADILGYYARGLERARLDNGVGALEFARTRALLERFLPPAPAIVADVGGGPGRYALWLAERGYRVVLVDPVPLHIEQARLAAVGHEGADLVRAEVGDARSLPLPDASADAVLLLGPLYHLPERADRLTALGEARRICRRGGVIIVAAISRHASTLDGLRSGYLEDPTFAGIAAADRRDGRHENPTGDLAYFTTAYFHRPEELAAELLAAGLEHQATLAVEGPAWLLPDLDARLADERRREVLLDALAALESEPILLGASAHLLAVARRI